MRLSLVVTTVFFVVSTVLASPVAKGSSSSISPRQVVKDAVTTLAELKTIQFSFDAKAYGMKADGVAKERPSWRSRGTVGIDFATGAYLLDSVMLAEGLDGTVYENHRYQIFTKGSFFLHWINPHKSRATEGDESRIILIDSSAIGVLDWTHFMLGLWQDLISREPFFYRNADKVWQRIGKELFTSGTGGIEITTVDENIDVVYSRTESAFTQISYYLWEDTMKPRLRSLYYRISGRNYIDTEPVRFPTEIVFEDFLTRNNEARVRVRCIFSIDPQSIRLNEDLSDFLQVEIPASLASSAEREWHPVVEAAWAEGSTTIK